MILTVLDSNYEPVFVIDRFESLIWADRFNSAGDFELYMPYSKEVFDACKPGLYASIAESDRLMIIENVTIDTDFESGNFLTISGRSLESILDRRIVWSVTTIGSGTTKRNGQTGIKKLISDAIISPSKADRKIDNFIFEESTDEGVLRHDMNTQFPIGTNLYDAVASACIDYKIGFKVILNNDNKFVFSLYNGVDRSYAQDTLPWVVFSPEYGNTKTTSYTLSWNSYKNVCYVTGELTSDTRKPKRSITMGTVKGLDRREIWSNSSSISKTDESGNTISDSKYDSLLKASGKKFMKDHGKKETFDIEIETTNQFIYGVDYNLGDFIQVSNAYNINTKARVTEFIFNEDAEGYKCYPVFEVEDPSTDLEVTS